MTPDFFKKMESFPVPTHFGWRPWYDVYLYAGWRIQRNERKKTFRIIGPEGVCREFPSEKECFDFLEQKKKGGLKPASSHFVLLIPGLNNSPLYFGKIQKALKEAGYESMTVDYPSGFEDVRGHARRIAAIIDRLEDVETLSFVTHSMGGLILRVILADHSSCLDRFERGRIVMIAPPHEGSFLADFIHDRLKLKKLHGWACGRVGIDLTGKGAGTLPRLESPAGLIVGGTRRRFGFNPLTAEDNDGLVSLKSSRSEESADFIQISGWSHTLMLWNPRTIAQVHCFLREGKFNHGV